ncbi:hypothetical protein [Actibacterium sp. 188UL27-1]|uniref:hypothetical protein n=1 Tax=Actibacterium sp. 188UL27-1 TaxID=2786961 RepID=UPI001956A151|nr:hypothetical protein [Actibacterium sp. 188UL27-1]MBM7066050.1 hypothetical protein [Actibacterium sp. 188UL27-1]
MTEPATPRGKAAALLAYALDIEAPDSVSPPVLRQLVDEVCLDDLERARLVSLLSTSQSPQLPSVILELLGTRLDTAKNALETVEDKDAVYGIWSQRTASGAILAGVGFAASGIITGGWAIVAVGASIFAGGATSYGRDRLKRRARSARRAVEQTERLIEAIKSL